MDSLWITFAGSPVFSFQIVSPLAKGLFHKAIMESGVAIIPYLKASDDERNEDVGILLTPLQLLPLGQERMWSGVDKPYALLSLLAIDKDVMLAHGESCGSMEGLVQ